MGFVAISFEIEQLDKIFTIAFGIGRIYQWTINSGVGQELYKTEFIFKFSKLHCIVSL